MGQLARAKNPRHQGGLPNDIELNPKQVNTVTTRSGLQPKELGRVQVNHKATNGYTIKIKRIWLKKKLKARKPEWRKRFYLNLSPKGFKRTKRRLVTKKILEILKEVHINLPLIDSLKCLLKFLEYVKNNVINKNHLT